MILETGLLSGNTHSVEAPDAVVKPRHYLLLSVAVRVSRRA
jgi:hypothetical protein